MDKDLKLDDCQLMFGDCIERMKEIPDKSCQLIFTDLPYQQIAAGWDSIIPMEKLWDSYNRIISKDGTPITGI